MQIIFQIFNGVRKYATPKDYWAAVNNIICRLNMVIRDWWKTKEQINLQLVHKNIKHCNNNGNNNGNDHGNNSDRTTFSWLKATL